MRLASLCVRLFCIAILLFVAACDSPKEKEAKYVEHGKELFDSGDLVRAKLEFKNALQINPVGSEAQYYLGRIAEKQNDLAGAAAAYRRAADNDPNHLEANLKAGQLTLMSGDPNAAAVYADRVLALKPDRPEGHTLKAAILLMQGKLDAADKEANAALALDPKNVDAFVILAGRQTRDSHIDEALKIVERGLQANPKSTDILLIKLKLLYDQKRIDDVIGVLRQLHAVQPDNANFVIDLANQLAASGKLDEADSMFKEAMSSAKNPEALVSAYAGFLASHRGVEEAIKQIKALIDSQKLPPRYVLLLEQLYLKVGKFDQAQALMVDLEQNGTVADDRLQARVELARIALLKGDKPGALKQLDDVFKDDAQNQSALLLRGLIMLDDKKYDSAMADARSVLHEDINSVGGLSVLAKAYTATGDTDLAIQTLRSLVRVAPTDVDARLQLASLLAPKSPADALDQVDAAIALRPDAGDLQVQKAQFLIRTGSIDKAEVVGRELVKQPKFSAKGHMVLGEAAFARSDYKTAISEIEQAEAQGMSFDAVGPALMNAYVKAGMTDEAEAMLNKRIAGDPSDAKAVALLATLRAQSGDAQDAETLFRRAIKIHPDDSATYLNLAKLLTDQHRLEEAAKLMVDARARFPSNDKVATFAAISLDTAGNFEEAKSAYQEILKKWPNNTIAANNLAALIADVWPKDKALLDHARQMAEPFRNSSNGPLLDTLGWVQTRQGNFDDATILLLKATSLMPDNQQIQFHYAMALAGKGLNAKAKEALSLALQGGPVYRGLDEAKQLMATLK